MFTGFVIMIISTLSKYIIEYLDKKKNDWSCFLVFASSKSYSLLFMARAIQGIGSACSSVSGEAKNDLITYLDSYRSRNVG